MIGREFARSAPTRKLFMVPAGLVRILDRDLGTAGIPGSWMSRRRCSRSPDYCSPERFNRQSIHNTS